MNNFKKLSIAIAGTALAGTLALSGSAFASNGDATGTPSPEKIAKVCARVDDIDARIDQAKARIAERITKLQERRATAEAAGHDKVVKNIDRRLERLQKLSDKIVAKEAKFDTFVSKHCDAPAPADA
ncbi:unnamed protein product [Phaeothamnion confervicola]